jgi:hypothetical protein
LRLLAGASINLKPLLPLISPLTQQEPQQQDSEGGSSSAKPSRKRKAGGRCSRPRGKTATGKAASVAASDNSDSEPDSNDLHSSSNSNAKDPRPAGKAASDSGSDGEGSGADEDASGTAPAAAAPAAASSAKRIKSSSSRNSNSSNQVSEEVAEQLCTDDCSLTAVLNAVRLQKAAAYKAIDDLNALRSETMKEKAAAAELSAKLREDFLALGERLNLSDKLLEVSFTSSRYNCTLIAHAYSAVVHDVIV